MGNGRTVSGPGSYNNRDRDQDRGKIFSLHLYPCVHYFKYLIKAKKVNGGPITVPHLGTRLKRSENGNNPMETATNAKRTANSVDMMTIFKCSLGTFLT